MRPVYTKPSDLPLEGAGFEMQLLDFKTTSQGSAAFHMAKDVAALANHLGGSIVVGAKEVSGILDRYEPLDPVDAAEQHRAYDEAVSQLCSPVPLYRVERIPMPHGIVLAINVEPQVNGLVGVRVSSVKEDVGWGGKAWIFPMRTGSQCRFVQPSELAMFTTGHVRRMAILLSGIPATAALYIAEENENPGGRTVVECRVLRVDEVANNVRLQLHMSPNKSEITKPLDRFETVYEEADGNWRAFMSATR